MKTRPAVANRWTIILMMLTASASIHHPTVIAPFLNEIGAEFSASDAIVGQIGTVTFGASFLVALAFAPFIGRLELGRLLAAAVALIALAGLITAVSPVFWLLFPARAIAGLGGGIAAAGSMAALGRAWPNADERKAKQGFVVGALAGGPAILTPILRIIGEHWSWHTAVATHSLFYLGASAIVFAFMPRLAGDAHAGDRLGKILRQAAGVIAMPRVGLPLTLRLTSQTLLTVVTVFLAGFIDDQYFEAGSWIGPAFGMLAFGFMLASFSAGRVMSSLGGPANSVLFMTWVLVAAAVSLAWITPHPRLTATFAMVFGVSVGLFFNGVVALIFEGAGERFATAMFVDGALVPTGGLVGSILGGIALTVDDYSGWKILVTGLGIAIFVPLLATLRSIASTPSPSTQ